MSIYVYGHDTNHQLVTGAAYLMQRTLRTERELVDAATRNKSYQRATGYSHAARQALVNHFGADVVERARHDETGNCLTCGEAGRCYGWHVRQWVDDQGNQIVKEQL